MNELWQFTLVAFTSILFLVDPFAVIPAYLAFTRADTAAHRRRTATIACVAAAIALLIFAAGGDLILRAFGITLPAFRIAGGLIIMRAAFSMLNPDKSGKKLTEEDEAEAMTKEDITFSPLAMPMLSGPGSIAATSTGSL
jgi:multiple antibiotic resistance protein